MKIEFDLPKFEKELNINIIIRKDGEVVYSTSSSSGDIKKEVMEEDIAVSNTGEGMNVVSSPLEKQSQPQSSAPSSSFGGNMMNLEF